MTKAPRWRAGLKERYWTIVSNVFVQWNVEKGSERNAIDWERGNYFRTEEQAQAAAERVKALLLQIHEEEERCEDWELEYRRSAARSAIRAARLQM